MSHIVAICHIEVTRLHIVAICHIAVDMLHSLTIVVIADFIYFSEFVCCQISRAWIFSNLFFILHQIFPCSIFTVIEADLVNFHTESSITSSSASCALF